MRRRGSILARDNKNGTRTYYIKYSVEGRPVKRAVGRSRREAERALVAALAAVDRGATRPPSRQTFGELANTWLERKRPRIEPSTYRDYEIHVRTRLKPAFGDLRLQQITRGKVESYLAALDARGELSRKTINDSLIPLRQILHAYWVLQDPIEAQAAEHLNQLIAARLGADLTVTGVRSPMGMLRLPGTVNRKREPYRQVRLVECTQRRYSVEELLHAAA